jgi:hypothetical protein
MHMADELPAVPPPSFQLRLPTLPVGWQVIRYAALADGTLAVISTDVDLATEHQRIRAAHLASSSYDHTRLNALAAGGTARVWIAGSPGWTEALSFSLETPFPIFDRFEDGRWLVANRPSREPANARVLSPDGATLARFKLGDGVSHLGVDASDRIWVGWTDEGMFGNGDWSVPGHEWPPCSNGVACFTPSGMLLPLPQWPKEAGNIADCYALNVLGPGALTCPYTEFPIVRFFPDKPICWWRNALSGPEAVATDDTHALIAGGYTENANRLTLVALEGVGQGDDARQLASWALPLRRLPPPPNEWAPVWYPPDLLDGRGDMLHLVSDGLWQRWRVADLVALK